MTKPWIVAIVVTVVIGTLAFAGTPVDQGAPGNQGSWPVRLSGVSTISIDGGLPVSEAACAAPRHTVLDAGTAAFNCPSTQLSNRRFIVFCHSAENGTGAALVKIRIDGSAPAIGRANVGDVLGAGDCVKYSIESAIVPQCITDTVGTAITTFECR